MATENFSAALCAPASASVPSTAHPMAAPGYGKRSAPDQAPRRTDDFQLLPERERYIAAFVDRLPEGAAMTVKTLARQLPRYGQQAVSTALTALSVAGHLRRIRRLAGDGDQVRWVFRTFWSRTARDNEWWTTFLAAEDGRVTTTAPVSVSPPPYGVPAQTPAAVRPVEAKTPDSPPMHGPAPTAPVGAPATVLAVPLAVPVVAQQPKSSPDHPSPGYLALAQLGCAEPRLALSANDCKQLEGLALEWLARGVSPAYIVQALAAGLPAEPINSPLGFVRRRLKQKTPPHQPSIPAPGTVGSPARRLLVECTKCGTPGRPEALPDGLCHACRPGALPTGRTTTATDTQAATARTARDVHARVEILRALARTS
ncbi:MarR family transcriptional regulator [Streptomyces sp. NBC_01014]|uniref:MarR family transcriptional regulator n=1 Tax=Streptomyces sp. NBC_01014 TaxID=2903719 RepID=UPI0038665621|nr:MarR family transcriptional regulator [Streptomyces sp. NBC_01014]